jgi:glutamate/aspartate transport system permease protein
MFDVLLERAPDGKLYIEWIITGFGWTMALSFIGWWIAFVVGTLAGAGRTTHDRLVVWICRAYIEIFRNIPVLVQMFLWFFVLPELLPRAAGAWMKQMPPPWSAFWPALICLGLYTGARVAEQVRTGIEALPIGQREASAALGLSTGQSYRFVLVPQALRLIIPSLTSEVMGIYKNSSVALTIGLLELTAQAHRISEETFQTFAAFAAATAVYLAMALGAYQLMMFIDRLIRIPGMAPEGKKEV